MPLNKTANADKSAAGSNHRRKHGMEPYEIRYRLLKAGYTIRKVAQELGVRSPTVSMCLAWADPKVKTKRRVISKRVREHIASVTGVSYIALWGTVKTGTRHVTLKRRELDQLRKAITAKGTLTEFCKRHKGFTLPELSRFFAEKQHFSLARYLRLCKLVGVMPVEDK